jgi:diphthine-ammonia ligase
MASPNPSGLDVIALISGGKDSLYSILHCVRNGHRVVALANLHPPVRVTEHDGDHAADQQQADDDMDSFMYQTIGHGVIPLYERALGIPLYRAPITGDAVDTSRVYRQDAVDDDRAVEEEREEKKSARESEDETESLVPLLKRIMEDHPHANAVSAGAILSTYQRTRIENVAGRLGLVPLAWLWMYPELPPPAERRNVLTDTGLLDDMAAAGCDARIIKVASGGLDADSLWENVASVDGGARRRIAKAMKRFAADDLTAAVLGEGGEYETLAVDGPAFLWKQRIVIEQRDRQVKMAGGGVSYLAISNARCEAKDEQHDGTDVLSVRRPGRLDEPFETALDALHALHAGLSHESGETVGRYDGNVIDTPPENFPLCQSRDGRLWTISNISGPGPTAAEQMDEISRKLEQILSLSTRTPKTTTNDIVFATVLLRSMQDFGSINSAYATLFKRPNPPARVTVACGDSLPAGVDIMVSFTFDLGSRDGRQGLHVQSRSYWAPANIGPYSQAITVPCQKHLSIEAGGGLVFIAGQIPLEPASMEIADGLSRDEDTWLQNFSLHATLSLQHLWRIGAATQVDWWLGAVVFLSNDGRQRSQAKAKVAVQLWNKLNNRPVVHDDDDGQDTGLDAWDIKYGRREDFGFTTQYKQSLPNFHVVDDLSRIPPVFAVEVAELPRGSDIEWQGLGCRCNRLALTVRDMDTDGLNVKIWSTTVDDHSAFYSIEIGDGNESSSRATPLHTLMQDLGAAEGVAQSTIYTSYASFADRWKGQVVPCKTVWGSEGQRITAAITVRTVFAAG